MVDAAFEDIAVEPYTGRSVQLSRRVGVHTRTRLTTTQGDKTRHVGAIRGSQQTKPQNGIRLRSIAANQNSARHSARKIDDRAETQNPDRTADGRVVQQVVQRARAPFDMSRDLSEGVHSTVSVGEI